MTLAAAVLAVVPFAGSLAGGFVYDDHALIEQRAAIHSLARIGELWRSEFWEGLGAIHFRYLRPLVSMSYALDWSLYDGRPMGFHLTNLLLHGTVAALVCSTLTRWSQAPWGALVVTLAWAWHPSKVEAVSWIAGRTDLLCAVGILVVCAGVKRRLSGSLRTGIALEIAGMFVALASKEHAVVTPLFAFVEAWAHFGSRRVDRKELGRAGRVVLPHAALVSVYLIARIVFLPLVPEQAGKIPFFDARMYTLETLGEFARIVLYPIPLSIQRAPIRVDDAFKVLHDPMRLAIGALFAGAIAAVILTRYRRSGADERVAGTMLGLVALLPVANVLSARMVFLFAERFAYIPLMGFALALAPTVRPRIASLAPWMMVLAASFVFSLQHTDDFLDDRHLWQHELAVHPRQPMALRFATEDAMRRHDYRTALDFALRGYQASNGWPVPQPDHVEFAVRAARSLEILTLDRDRDALAEVNDFYRVLLAGRGFARIDRLATPVVIDAGSAEARNFRQDAGRLAPTKLWAAVVASRIAECDGVMAMARDYLSWGGDVPGRVSAVLSLARCTGGSSSAWDEIVSHARALVALDANLSELVANLAWARGALENNDPGVDGAVRRSRARTLLLDRGRAYGELVPYESVLLSNREASLFFARTAWAAGEDIAAHRALSARVPEPDANLLLTTWSRELGRD